ncbi:CshA/CshB family fibrillar adhesin-related protein [Leifsonia sp. LS-T14]|uniref:CshA/CshB family fibrillar adhesin-related protein n=1 Tax=unclassified Leifsonia TaxID=2663824 RepID=UPI0035A6CEF6
MFGKRRTLLVGLARVSAVCLAVAAMVVGVGMTAPANAEYASGGSGRYKGSIDWFEWGADHVAIAPEGGVRTNTRLINGHPLTTTCGLSNIAGELETYASGRWEGDGFDDLYNVDGTGDANNLVAGIANAVDDALVSFTFQCSVTFDGVPVPTRGLVVADAEASNGAFPTGEYIEVTPLQPTTWRVIDRYRGANCNASVEATRTVTSLALAVDGPECFYTDGEPGGPTAVLFMEGANSASVTLKGGFRTAVALGVVLQADFGDAPAGYPVSGALFEPTWEGGELPLGPTLVSGDDFPLATLGTAAPRLGAQIDSEATPLVSATATGDDLDSSDDEDAVSAPVSAAVLPGDTHSVGAVPCTGPGFVRGWIDWNADGAFDDDEGSATVECTQGTVDLSWSVPADVAYGDSFLRLRIAATPEEVATPSGLALHGETEDHQVTVSRPTAALALVKTGTLNDADHDGLADSGETIQYTFLLTNTGEVALSTLTVTDPKAGSVSCPVGTLQPGSSTTCTADALYTVTDQDVQAGQVVNTATANGDVPPGVAPIDPPSSTAITPTQRILSTPGATPSPGTTISAVTPAGRLPSTGSDVPTAVLAVTAMLVLTGALLLAAGRRRRTSR